MRLHSPSGGDRGGPIRPSCVVPCLLAPGGTLVPCSCSYHIPADMFGAILHEASIDSRVPVTIVEKRMQGRDHPVLMGVPETYYLKCFILRRVE